MLGHVSSPDLEAWATIQRNLKIATNIIGPGTETRTSLSLLYSSKHKNVPRVLFTRALIIPWTVAMSGMWGPTSVV